MGLASNIIDIFAPSTKHFLQVWKYMLFEPVHSLIYPDQLPQVTYIYSG